MTTINVAMWQTDASIASDFLNKMVTNIKYRLLRDDRFTLRPTNYLYLKRPSEILTMCKADETAFLAFTKQYKVSWQSIIMCQTESFEDKADLVIIDHCGKYLKRYLDKVDIPVIDLHNKIVQARLRPKLLENVPVEVLGTYLIEELEHVPYNKHYLLPCFDSERRFLWQPRTNDSAA